MKVAVVFESVLGNTKEIAEAVADGLRQGMGEVPGAEVTVAPVADADTDALAGALLLVVGGPTHAFSMSTETTRESAASDYPDQAETDPHAPGLREWLKRLGDGAGRAAAAFDTRVKFPLPGHAATAIAKDLKRHGYELVVKPEGFFVKGKEGPLLDGEVERAREWGRGLAAALPGDTGAGAR